MRRAILFRFHSEPEICRNRIGLLQRFNPGVPIRGLYGGDGEPFLDIQTDKSQSVDPVWNWKHGDLCVREWYRRSGSKLPFDMLHVIEWDLLLLAPLDALYGHIPDTGVGLTALTKLELVDRWQWVDAEPHKSEWRELQALARQEYGFRGEAYACLGPGYCLPKAFLEAYSSEDIPRLCHEELRLPLFAQILGFELHDTRLTRWKEDKKYLNCWRNEIAQRVIDAEMKKENGKRAFHPYYREYTVKEPN